jgi:hypothetical protein
MRRRAAASTTGKDYEGDNFRRLVRKEITADDYVKSLERRVEERREETANGHSNGDSETDSES